MEGSVQMMKHFRRYLSKPNWHNLRTLQPLSREFGFDRGTPIDRVYIEDFLNKHTSDMRGVLCEIADSTYSDQFANKKVVDNIEVLHYTNDNLAATIIGDLTAINTLPKDKIDCFIVTQTLNFIEDAPQAVAGIHHILAPKGVALITVAGLCQISRYDMDRWGDYWRFTDLSLRNMLEKVFGKGSVSIETYGNVLTATALLHGLAAEELTEEEIKYQDKDYQIVITARVVKNETFT